MTRFTSRSGEDTDMPVMYESAVWHESRLLPGVQFQVLRMSLIRRHRLTQKLLSLMTEKAFHSAALNDAASEIAAAELQGRIDEIVIRTGLLEIRGLNIDGPPATIESLIENGPERLTREIADAIADESSLNEDEQKN